MTCIIGIKYDGKIIMAADSQVVLGDLRLPVTYPSKIWCKDSAMVGCRGYGSIIQYFRYSKEIQFPKDFDTEYLVNSISPKIRQFWQDHPDESPSFEALIASANKLYYLGLDGYVQIMDTFHAIGSGAPYANAVLLSNSMGCRGIDIKHLLWLSLKVSSEFVPSVSSPFCYAYAPDGQIQELSL